MHSVLSFPRTSPVAAFGLLLPSSDPCFLIAPHLLGRAIDHSHVMMLSCDYSFPMQDRLVGKRKIHIGLQVNRRDAV